MLEHFEQHKYDVKSERHDLLQGSKSNCRLAGNDGLIAELYSALSLKNKK